MGIMIFDDILTHFNTEFEADTATFIRIQHDCFRDKKYLPQDGVINSVERFLYRSTAEAV